MNYNAIKRQGYLFNLTAKHMLSYEDVFQAAATLPQETFEYTAISTDAIIEFYYAVLHEPNVAVHLADQYILTEASKKFFPWELAVDMEAGINFLDRDLGNEYTILGTMTVDYGAIYVLAHPELHNEEYLNVAHTHFQERIRNSEKKDHPNMKKLFPFLNEEEKVVANSSRQPKKEEERFEIKNNRQCSDVLDYLITTGVIDESTTIDFFAESIARADMSGIKPIRIDKYRMAVARMVSMIKSNPYKWQKLACASLGTTASKALGNVTKNAEWDEELCKILPKLRRK